MSNPERPKRSQQVLEALGDTALRGVVDRAKALARLEASLLGALPVTLRPHCRLANAHAGAVVFLVTSPTWKSRLRLHQETLLRSAQEAGVAANVLTIKVVPDVAGPEPTSPGTPLSDTVRDALRTTADSVADPGLRDQLLKLANHRPGGKTR